MRLSTRRDARVRDLPGVVGARRGVPRALLVGPMIETWTGPVALSFRGDSQESVGAMTAAVAAMRRWAEVRRSWLDGAGITDEHERRQLTPGRRVPFEAVVGVYLTRIGHGAEVLVANRLAAVGAVLEDVPGLRREANDLLDLAESAAHMSGGMAIRRN
jgi:hypothetical protein